MSLHVKDFGAVGRGDESEPLAKAINAARTLSEPLWFDAKQYQTSQPLTLKDDIELRGKTGARPTEILAIAPMNALVVVDGQVRVHNMVLNANRVAKRAVECVMASRSTWENVTFYEALEHGFWAGAGAPCISFLKCGFEMNGTLHHSDGATLPNCAALKAVAAGIVSLEAGSSIITGSGTQWADIGVYPGCFIHVGPHRFQVDEVLDNEHLKTLTLTPALETLTGQPWRIGVGDGFYQDPSSDGAFVNFDRWCLLRNNANVGGNFLGFWGGNVRCLHATNNGSFGISVGRIGITPMCSEWSSLYFEDNGADAAMYLSHAPGIAISGLLSDVFPLAYSNPSFLFGELRNAHWSGGYIWSMPIGDPPVASFEPRRVWADLPVSAGFNPPDAAELRHKQVQPFVDPVDGSLKFAVRSHNYVRVFQAPEVL